MNKLYRSSQNKMLAGVCAGVADFFGWNVGFVRLLWLVLAFAGVGAPVLFYLILAFILPVEGSRESYTERMEKKLKK